MAGLRENIGKRVLGNKVKNFKRETRVHNFKTASTAVILFNADVPGSMKVIKEFRDSLKKEGVTSTVFGYVNQKEVPEEMLFWKDVHMITRKDLNWYYKPGGEIVELFYSKDPDILIDFSRNISLELQFLVQLSEARFKIGNFTEQKNDYDLMINASAEDDMAFISEQITHYVSMLNPVN